MSSHRHAAVAPAYLKPQGYQATPTYERIEAAFDKDMTVQEVADMSGMGRKHLWQHHSSAIRRMIKRRHLPLNWRPEENRATIALSATSSGLAKVARKRKAKP